MAKACEIAFTSHLVDAQGTKPANTLIRLECAHPYHCIRSGFAPHCVAAGERRNAARAILVCPVAAGLLGQYPELFGGVNIAHSEEFLCVAACLSGA